MGRSYVVSTFVLCCLFHIADGCRPRLHVVGNLWRDPTQTLNEGWRIRKIAAVHIEHHLRLGFSLAGEQSNCRLGQGNVLLRSHAADISVNDFGGF